jgi:predicted nucleic-acid-binding Zn-ribbon protein
MSELVVESKNILATQRLAGMFDAALPKISCQACKKAEFTLLNAPDGDYLTAVHYYAGSDPIPKKFTQTIAVACSNCGYVMHFILPAVKKLALENGWQDKNDD